jgi:hypothetical protein
LSRLFALPGKADRGVGSALSGPAHRFHDVLGPHAVAEVGVDEAGFDPAVTADHEGGWDGQEPAAIPLELPKPRYMSMIFWPTQNTSPS